MSVSYDFANKTAIVTGGSKGIGRAIVERLKNSGAKVCVWDIAPAHLDGVSYATVDVSKSDQIDKAVSETVSRASSIDILVNNAGYLGDPVAVEKVRPDDWRHVFDVHLTGVFEVSRKIIPHMRRSSWGRIVNMASVAGKEGFPICPLTQLRARVSLRSRSHWERNWPTPRFRVNAVAPAAADTDMISTILVRSY